MAALTSPLSFCTWTKVLSRLRELCTEATYQCFTTLTEFDVLQTRSPQIFKVGKGTECETPKEQKKKEERKKKHRHDKSLRADLIV